MTDRHLKFIDFVFDKLSVEYGSEDSLGDLSYDYKKEFNINLKDDEIKFLEDKFFNDLFDPIGNVGLFKLTTRAKEIKDEFGSYSNYIKSQNQETINYQEVKDLEKENLKLDIENKKYLKTIREQEYRIRDLTELNSSLQYKHLKRYIFYSILSFIGGLIIANWKYILLLLHLITPEQMK